MLGCSTNGAFRLSTPGKSATSKKPRARCKSNPDCAIAFVTCSLFRENGCPKEYRQHELNDRAGGILQTAPAPDYLGKRSRYSPETMNALTISACSKLPLNWFSLFSQNAKPLGVRVAPQVAEVFHHHKRFVELRAHETSVLRNTPAAPQLASLCPVARPLTSASRSAAVKLTPVCDDQRVDIQTRCPCCRTLRGTPAG